MPISELDVEMLKLKLPKLPKLKLPKLPKLPLSSLQRASAKRYHRQSRTRDDEGQHDKAERPHG